MRRALAVAFVTIIGLARSAAAGAGSVTPTPEPVITAVPTAGEAGLLALGIGLFVSGAILLRGRRG